MFDWMSESLTDLLTDIKIILNSFYFWLNDNKAMSGNVWIFFILPYEILHSIVIYTYEILVSSTILLCNKTAKITIIYSLIPQT